MPAVFNKTGLISYEVAVGSLNLHSNSCIPTWFRFLHVLPAAAPVGHAVDGVAGVLALALAGVVHQPVRAQLPAGATCNMTHVYRADTCTWPAGMVDTTPRTLSNCFGQF